MRSGWINASEGISTVLGVNQDRRLLGEPMTLYSFAGDWSRFCTIPRLTSALRLIVTPRSLSPSAAWMSGESGDKTDPCDN